MKVVLEDGDKVGIRVLKNKSQDGYRLAVDVKINNGLTLLTRASSLEISVDDAFKLGLLPNELQDNYYGNILTAFKYLRDNKYSIEMNIHKNYTEYSIIDTTNNHNNKINTHYSAEGFAQDLYDMASTEEIREFFPKN